MGIVARSGPWSSQTSSSSFISAYPNNMLLYSSTLQGLVRHHESEMCFRDQLARARIWTSASIWSLKPSIGVPLLRSDTNCLESWQSIKHEPKYYLGEPLSNISARIKPLFLSDRCLMHVLLTLFGWTASRRTSWTRVGSAVFLDLKSTGVQAIFARAGRGGRAVNYFPKKFSQVAQIFTKKSSTNEDHRIH